MQRLDININLNEIIDTPSDQTIRLIVKYCPFDIVDRGVKYGINFYLANFIFHNDINQNQFFETTQALEKYFSLLSHTHTVEFLLQHLNNPQTPQIIAKSSHLEHYQVLSKLIKKHKSVI